MQSKEATTTWNATTVSLPTHAKYSTNNTTSRITRLPTSRTPYPHTTLPHTLRHLAFVIARCTNNVFSKHHPRDTTRCLRLRPPGKHVTNSKWSTRSNRFWRRKTRHSRSITDSGVPTGSSPKRALAANRVSSIRWTSSGVAQVSAMVLLRKKYIVNRVHTWHI